MSARLRMARGAAMGAAVSAAACLPAPLLAGLPGPGRIPFDPSRCAVALSGQGSACQFRFFADGTADVLSVNITLRDAFDVPVPNCSTSVTLVPVGPDSHNFCTCCGDRKTGFSAADGTLSITWGAIGGFGSLEARVTVHCVGNIAIAAPAFDYTSADLVGDCGSGGPATAAENWALWARGIAPGVWQPADWNCSGGSADINDAGGIYGGIGTPCGACP